MKFYLIIKFLLLLCIAVDVSVISKKITEISHMLRERQFRDDCERMNRIYSRRKNDGH